MRHWKKQPVYTAINLIGLAVGVACCAIITMYVWNELTYDRHHQNSDRIFRVNQTTIAERDHSPSAATPFPLNDAFLTEFPAYVEAGVRFFNLQSESVAIENPETDERFRQRSFYFTEASLFDVFDVPLLQGNPETALAEPNTIIITPQIATLYFGEEDPVGQQLLLEGRVPLTVTGIMEEWSKNSHFRPELLASFESLRGLWGNYDQIVSRWRWTAVWTYVLLTEGTHPALLEWQLPEFSDKYYSDFFSEAEQVELHLQPLADIWLYSNADITREIEPTNNYLVVWLFAAVAVLILIIACINFINLSTARAMQRSKEVGLRKTMGAGQPALIRQFMFESVLYTCLAVLIGIAIFAIGLPWFSQFTGREILVGDIGTAGIITTILLLFFAVAVFSGLYPSFVLSSFNPVESLRGVTTKGKKGGFMRKGLVVFQFTVTAILLIGTALVYKQLIHLQQKEMGFDKESVLIIPASSMSITIWYYDEFKERVQSHSGVLSVSGTQYLPGGSDTAKYNLAPEGHAAASSFPKIFVMHDFLETLGIELMAGRDFSTDFSTDPEQAVLINKKLLIDLGWETPEEALGKTFRHVAPGMDERISSVVGVVDDFHHSWLRTELEPLVMELPGDQNQRIANIAYYTIRLAPGDPRDAIRHIQTIWDDIDTVYPFEYWFLDEKLDEIYQTEEKLSHLLGLFALLAITIGCLGLLGLSAYSVSSRTKEIAIRKTLGLSAPGVFYLLSKDYLKLIVVAHLVALPLSYYFANRWLQYFPYQIDLLNILLVMFVVSLIVSLFITLLTISSQCIKASRLNPVESLKSE